VHDGDDDDDDDDDDDGDGDADNYCYDAAAATAAATANDESEGMEPITWQRTSVWWCGLGPNCTTWSSQGWCSVLYL